MASDMLPLVFGRTTNNLERDGCHLDEDGREKKKEKGARDKGSCVTDGNGGGGYVLVVSE